MEAPRLPPDEAERLAALYELKILDTPPEERFDRITRLATKMFDLPIAYVAFVDANRQWLKSICGLSFSESPRDASFCGHAILGDEVLVIPDALRDPRFADNPLVIEDPHIRFYAGAPLSAGAGFKVGTLCVADSRPRSFDQHDLEVLKSLALLIEDGIGLIEVVALQGEIRAAKRALELAKEELEIRNEFIRKAFGCYLSEQVVDSLLASHDGLELGGSNRRVSILMSDLRDFTPMCEKLAPEEVVEVLNRYLGAMIEVISRHGGTIDEFIGDAILVIFGAPVSRENDVERAVACAVDMQLAMEAVNAANRRDGLPALAMGIGIHTGDVVVGNIGSCARMKYSVVGSPVNLTARIQSMTLGGQILISEATRRELGDLVDLIGQLRVKVKGIAGPVPIYDVGGIGGRYGLFLPQAGQHVLSFHSGSD